MEDYRISFIQDAGLIVGSGVGSSGSNNCYQSCAGAITECYIGSATTGSKIMKTRYSHITPYQTKDGSIIRELLHPSHHNIAHQSLAEATIPPKSSTHLHKHRQSEEIYHITSGEGLMHLGGKIFPVQVGDSICIPPQTPHKIHNSSSSPLVILCCCAPPYSHADTEILG